MTDGTAGCQPHAPGRGPHAYGTMTTGCHARTRLLCVSLLAGMAAVGPHEVAAGTPDERPDIIVILISPFGSAFTDQVDALVRSAVDRVNDDPPVSSPGEQREHAAIR